MSASLEKSQVDARLEPTDSGVPITNSHHGDHLVLAFDVYPTYKGIMMVCHVCEGERGGILCGRR